MDYEGAYDWVQCRRAQFPEGCKTIADPGLLAMLAKEDPHAELIFNPRRGKWSLYRAKVYGATRGENLMVHEFDLDHPPGPWILGEMRRRCLVRPGETSMDPRIARRQFMQSIKNVSVERKRERDKKFRDCCREAARDIDAYAWRGKTSDVSSQFKKKDRLSAGGILLETA